MNPAEIREALRAVIDPELGVNIVDLGLVYAIEIVDNEVRVTMTMTTPACPLRDYVRDLVESTPDEPFGRVHGPLRVEDRLAPR